MGVPLTHDVIEHKRAEENLRESHARLRAVREGTTDAVFVRDLRGRYLMVNGYSPLAPSSRCWRIP